MRSEDCARRVSAICWFSYFGSYMGRIVLSAAMPAMISGLGFLKSEFGVISTLYYISFAIGQFVCVYAGDKTNPKNMVFFGISASAVLSAAMSFAASIPAMAAIWCVNGLAQSFVWPSVMKTLSCRLTAAKSKKAGASLQTAVAAGSFAAYLITAAVLKFTDDWRAVFMFFGVLDLCFSVFWHVGISKTEKFINKTRDECDSHEKPGKKPTGEINIPMRKIILGAGLPFVCAGIIVNGIIRDGLKLWTPTIVTEVFNLPPSLSNIITMFLPLTSISGVFISGYLLGKITGIMRVSALFFGLAAVILISLGVVANKNFMLTIIMICAASSCMIGANSILFGVLPMCFVKFGRISAISGFLSAFSCIGSSLSGIAIGFIAQSAGWDFSFAFLGATAVLGMAACVASMKSLERFLNLYKEEH